MRSVQPPVASPPAPVTRRGGVGAPPASSEYSCPVCLHVLCQPVSTSCGHAMCRSCAARVVLEFRTDREGLRCPVCRAAVHVPSFRRFAVSLPLWGLLQAVFPVEVGEREAAVVKDFSRALAELRGYGAEEGLGGERNGEHDRGHEVIHAHVPLALTKRVQGTRSHVRDADDYLMHLALAPLVDPNPLDLFTSRPARGSADRFALAFALLEMEEDEANETGFPTAVDLTEREHSCLVRTTFQGAVTLTLLGVRERRRRGAAAAEDDDVLLLRKTVDASDGVATFKVSMKRLGGGGKEENPDDEEEEESNHNNEPWFAPYKKVVVCAETNEARVQYSFTVDVSSEEEDGGESRSMPQAKDKFILRCVGGEREDEEGEDEEEDDEEEEDDDDDDDDLDGFIVHEDEVEDEGGSEGDGVLDDEEEEEHEASGDSDDEDDSSEEESFPRGQSALKRQAIVISDDEEEEDELDEQPHKRGRIQSLSDEEEESELDL